MAREMSSVQPRLRRRTFSRAAVLRCLAALLATTATTFAVTPITAAAALPGAPTITSTPVGKTVADPLTWTFTSPSAATSCQLTLANQVVSALADCLSPVTYDESTQVGGNFALTVYAADAADVVTGVTPSAKSGVQVAPTSAVFTSQPTSPGNKRSPRWTFKPPAHVGALCTFENGSGTAIAGPVACSTSYTATLTGQPDGTYTLVVTTKTAGVLGQPVSSAYSLITSAPAPTVRAPAAVGSDQTPTFAVTGVEPGATLTCTGSDASNNPVVVSDCGSSPQLQLGSSPDGVYSLSVTETDTLGNVSPAGTASYRLDTTPPAAPMVLGPASPGMSRTPSFAVSDSDAVAKYTCSVTGPTGATVTGCGTTTTLDLTGGNGVYTLSVVADDEVDNASDATTVTYTLEATAPPAPVVSGPATGNQDSASFTVSDDEDPLVTYTCTVTGPGVVTDTCGATTTINLAGATDGKYHLSVTATDGLGQSSPATKVTYIRDTTAPTQPSISGPTGPSRNLTPSFQVTASDADPLTYVCSVSPATASVSTCGPTTTLSLPATGGDGDYALSVQVEDPAGNLSTAAVANYTLDRTPPPTPVVVAPHSPNASTSPAFTITESMVGEPTAPTLSCVLTSPTAAVVFSGSCPAGGTFSLAGQPNGTYTLTVTASDLAGNTAAASATYTLDIQPVQTPTVSPAASRSNNLAPSFVATDSTLR